MYSQGLRSLLIMNFLDGEILYIDKPLGWTSFNVVSRVRNSLSRRMGIRRLKVGHAEIGRAHV